MGDYAGLETTYLDPDEMSVRDQVEVVIVRRA